MKVGFDSATGHADEQGRHQHLGNRDDVTSNRGARPSSGQPNGKKTDARTGENCSPDVGMDCSRLSRPGVRRDDDGHDDTSQPLAKHEFGKKPVGLDVNFVLLLLE